MLDLRTNVRRVRRAAQFLLASTCAASAWAQVCFEAVEPTATLPAGPVAQAYGDLDGDGDPDLVIACRDANSIAVLSNAGDGTFAAPVTYAVGLSPRAVGAPVRALRTRVQPR